MEPEGSLRRKIPSIHWEVRRTLCLSNNRRHPCFSVFKWDESHLDGQLLWENLPLSRSLATAALTQQRCLRPAVKQPHAPILHHHVSPCVGLLLERNTQQMRIMGCPSFKTPQRRSHASRAWAQLQRCQRAAPIWGTAKASPKQNVSARTSLCRLWFPVLEPVALEASVAVSGRHLREIIRMGHKQLLHACHAMGTDFLGEIRT